VFFYELPTQDLVSIHPVCTQNLTGNRYSNLMTLFTNCKIRYIPALHVLFLGSELALGALFSLSYDQPSSCNYLMIKCKQLAKYRQYKLRYKNITAWQHKRIKSWKKKDDKEINNQAKSEGVNLLAISLTLSFVIFSC
jgi:hypothetical protein